MQSPEMGPTSCIGVITTKYVFFSLRKISVYIKHEKVMTRAVQVMYNNLFCFFRWFFNMLYHELRCAKLAAAFLLLHSHSHLTFISSINLIFISAKS